MPIPVIQIYCYSVSVYNVKRSEKQSYIVCLWLTVLLLSFVCGKNFQFSITVLLLFFLSFFPSFFLLHRQLYLALVRRSTRAHSETCFQKSCSLCPHCTQHCTSIPPLPKKEKRKEKKAEAAMLTVASLQSLFNGTSIPASPGTLTGGRWGEWLWLPAMQDQPAAARAHCATVYASSLKQSHTRLCELPNWRHGCHEAVCVCERSWMMAVSSAPKRPEQETMSPAITASAVPTWCILLLKRRRRNLLQLNISAVETAS